MCCFVVIVASKSEIGPNRAIPCTAGRILNRFSKDIGFLDDLLPHTFLEYIFVSLIMWEFFFGNDMLRYALSHVVINCIGFFSVYS